MWNHLVVSSALAGDAIAPNGSQHDANCGRSVVVAEKETRSDEDTTQENTQEKESRIDVVTNNITTSITSDGPRMPFISDQEYKATIQRLSQVPHTAYQVDFAVVNCGMVISTTKRVIRFKFGFTNVNALNSGKKGSECQGNEHEVIVTWSLNSGKRAVAFDKHEVLFAIDETKTKLSHSWRDEEGHAYYLNAHAVNISLRTDTLLIPNPDWRQYDLFVDGVSFFRMPKLFEVGIGLKLPRDNLLPSVTPHPKQHDDDSEGAMSDLSDH